MSGTPRALLRAWLHGFPHRPWAALAAACALLVLAGACAPRVAPRFPEGQDYLFPRPWPGDPTAREARRIEKAWRKVRSGDAASAERQFQEVLRDRPASAAAETGLAYARLRAGRADEAAAGFARVLEREPEYVPALVGAGSAARATDPEAALRFYRRARALDPGEAAIERRLGELKLQVTERRVAEARRALDAGNREAAIAEYRMALEAAPEVSGLRLELAGLLEGKGDVAEAAAVLEADPSGDRQVLLRLGEVLERLREDGRALEAYRKLLARDPRDEEAVRRSLDVRRAMELLRMPEEYRAIPRSARLTRADLAALLSVKVTALSRVAPGKPDVAIDILGSWAREHILKALGLRLMDVYPNHTFQPAATVRRGDLARALQQVLDHLKWSAAPAPALTDMARGNLLYYPAARVVAAGLMDLTPSGAFEAWRPVSGEEAVRVVEALARLVGP